MKEYKYFQVFYLNVLILIFINSGVFAQTQKNNLKDQSVHDFQTPPDQSKPWAFFWWFNGYVDKPSITKHLEELKAKGLGGVVLYACESASIPKGATFMSPEWRTLFRFAVQEANRLGLDMGVNICYGWPAGGTWITPENNSRTFISSSQIVKGPQKFEGKLMEPLGKKDIYNDIIVQAIPLSEIPISNLLKITATSNQNDVINLEDGNYFTKWVGESKTGQRISEENPQWLQFEYNNPEEVNYLWLGAIAFEAPSLIDIQCSDDGVNFKKVATLQGDYLNQFNGGFPNTKSKFIRVVFKSPGSQGNHVNIGEIAIGLKPQVMRIMQLAAKRALNNPIGVTTTATRDQMGIVWNSFTPLVEDSPVSKAKILDITRYCSTEGKISWDVPSGIWKIIRLGETNTQVEAGGGLLVDYMNSKSTNQHFDQFMKLLIQDAGPLAGKTLKYFHEDNNEIGGPYNWTQDFLNEFRVRRGYDPNPYLSCLTGQLIDNLDITDRFLQDFRRTIADLVSEKHFQIIVDSSNKYGVGMEAEAGGQYLPFMFPHDALMNLGKMDIPVGEFWESSNWKENQYNLQGEMNREWIEEAQNVNAKEAATAGHIYGKKIIASEAFTSLGTTSHWYSTPADLLLHSNTAFCEGVNRLILHSSTTTKETDGKPGYEYDAGTHFNQNVTWWKDASPFFKFLSRCEYMLQKGLFVADVLYYNGDDIPNIVPAKHIPADLGFGYDYDVCNTEVLLNRLSVKNGRLTLPDGMSYRLMILPDSKYFNLAALKKIKQLVNEGAIIIGNKPEIAQGLQGYPESDNEIKKIAAELWNNSDLNNQTENKHGKGVIYCGKTAKEILIDNKIVPDFSFNTPDKHALIDFIHRRDGNMDIYYIANKRDSTVTVDCHFRISGKQPELWNPFIGNIEIAKAFSQKEGTISLPIQLSPYGSTFVVFQNIISKHKKGTKVYNYPKFIAIKEITGPYNVSFDANWGGPKSIIFDKLEDWSLNPQDNIRYYSGTARYSKSFTCSDLLSDQSNKKIILDLGNVQNTAHIWLNGKDLGVLWAPPYSVDISKVVNNKNNILEIEVTNTWVNRLIGDAMLPKEKRKTATNIRFSPNRSLKPSGLLGPVKLGYNLYE